MTVQEETLQISREASEEFFKAKREAENKIINYLSGKLMGRRANTKQGIQLEETGTHEIVRIDLDNMEDAIYYAEEIEIVIELKKINSKPREKKWNTKTVTYRTVFIQNLDRLIAGIQLRDRA